MKRLLVFNALLLLFSAIAQPADRSGKPVRTSICNMLRHPGRFNGRAVTIEAIYSVNWEWGTSLRDNRCESGVGYATSGADLTPNFSQLELTRDDAYRDFEQKEKLLCNGMSWMCDSDAIEAEFTGVFLSKKHLRKVLSREEVRGPVFIVTAIRNSKWRNTEDKLHLEESPPGAVPDRIPEAREK